MRRTAIQEPLTLELSRLEIRLDCILTPLSFLNPPLPTTQKQKTQWETYRPMQPPPILPKWDPPASIAPPCDGGFLLLGGRTACFQRGYCPQPVYDETMQLFADGFDHPLEGVVNGLRDLAYDFIIVIRARKKAGEEIAAACMVEVRCAEAQDAVPYLFIYELVTKRTYGRHGLAQQMVHATDTLAFLLKRDSEGRDDSIWRSTLRGRRLFLALTVDRTQETSYWQSLVRLYSKCGLYTRRADTPQFEYNSFTPYADFSWNIEKNPEHYIAMYKEAMPDVVYSDGAASVVVATKKGGYCASTTAGLPPTGRCGKPVRHFYATIPDDRVSLIRRAGLTPSAHACLHCSGERWKEVYIDQGSGEGAGGGGLIFRHQRPASGSVFVMEVICESDQFEMRSSAPHWFAAFIGRVDEIVPAPQPTDGMIHAECALRRKDRRADFRPHLSRPQCPTVKGHEAQLPCPPRPDANPSPPRPGGSRPR